MNHFILLNRKKCDFSHTRFRVSEFSIFNTFEWYYFIVTTVPTLTLTNGFDVIIEFYERLKSKIHSMDRNWAVELVENRRLKSWSFAFNLYSNSKLQKNDQIQPKKNPQKEPWTNVKWYLTNAKIIVETREDNYPLTVELLLFSDFMVFTGILSGIMLPVFKFGGKDPVFMEKNDNYRIFTDFFQERFLLSIVQLVAVTFPGGDTLIPCNCIHCSKYNKFNKTPSKLMFCSFFIILMKTKRKKCILNLNFSIVRLIL